MPTLDDLMAVVPAPNAEIRLRPHPDPAHDDSVEIQRAIDGRPKRIIFDAEVSRGVRADFKCRRPILVSATTAARLEGDTPAVSVLNFALPGGFTNTPGAGVVVYNPWILPAIPAYGVEAVATATGFGVGSMDNRFVGRVLDLRLSWAATALAPAGRVRTGWTYRHGGGTGAPGVHQFRDQVGDVLAAGVPLSLWHCSHDGTNWVLYYGTANQSAVVPGSLVAGQDYTVEVSITATSMSLTVNGTTATTNYSSAPFVNRGLDRIQIGNIHSGYGRLRDLWYEIERNGQTYTLRLPLTTDEWYGPCAKMYVTGPGIVGSQPEGYLPLSDAFYEARNGPNFTTLTGCKISNAAVGLSMYAVQQWRLDHVQIGGLVDGIRAVSYCYNGAAVGVEAVGGSRYGYYQGANGGYGTWLGGNIRGRQTAVRITNDFAASMRDVWIYDSERAVVVTESRCDLDNLYVYNEASGYTAPLVVADNGSYVTLHGGCQVGMVSSGSPMLAERNGVIRSFGTDYAIPAPGASDVIFRTATGGRAFSFGDSRAGTYNGSLVPWTNDPDNLIQTGALN